MNTDLYKPESTLVIEPLTPPAGDLPFARQLDETESEVRMGSWEVGLFGCLQASMANSWMAWCLPCFPLAQISQRIGFAKYTTMLVILWGVYVAEWVLYSTLGVYPSSLYHVNFESDEQWWLSGYFILRSWINIMSVTGVVIIAVTWMLRVRVRTLLRIDGRLPHSSVITGVAVGNACEDGIWSFCCSCCVIAQMATQVKTYKKKNLCNFGPVDTLPAYSAA